MAQEWNPAALKYLKKACQKSGHQPVHIVMYSGAKKYLASQQLCKFSHLKRWERPVIFIIGTKKNPENQIVGFLMKLYANYGGK